MKITEKKKKCTYIDKDNIAPRLMIDREHANIWTKRHAGCKGWLFRRRGGGKWLQTIGIRVCARLIAVGHANTICPTRHPWYHEYRRRRQMTDG